MTMNLSDVVVDGVATYRLTRLVTKDVLTAGVRDRLVRRAYWRQPYGGATQNVYAANDAERGAWARYAEDDPNAPKLATLITCRWCAGMWVAVAVGVAGVVAPRPWRWTARMLTAASAAALLARLESD